jgi:hopene-associated glycosyltransferase HpnB
LLAELIAIASLAAWVYLFTARGDFWRIQPSPPSSGPAPAKFVCVVIPARNEESVVGQAVASLLHQSYPGRIQVIVVDDHSSDRTAAVAAEAGATVVSAGSLPQDWTGKLWALSEGVKAVQNLDPDYFLFTDADIVHAPNNVAGLVVRAESASLDLVSLMVKLRCQSLAERALIPAFVYFFFQLYPPSWIARRDRKTAGAAGGCILIRPRALARIGGIAAIRGELIDDCALARAVKAGGSIWLGVTEDTHSVRDYTSFAEIRRMISRTAFTQLRHSALLLAGTILGMAVIYLAPPLLILTGNPAAAVLGLSAWLLMAISYLPVVRFYRRSLAWAPLLPLVAVFYIVATVDSAVRYWAGRGGVWKDRVQDLR